MSDDCIYEDCQKPCEELADKLNVDIGDLHMKICAGINGLSISHFTDEELKFIKACVEVACDF